MYKHIICLLFSVAFLSACQLSKPQTMEQGQRVQGQLELSDGQWRFQQCNSEQAYNLDLSPEIEQQLRLIDGGFEQPVFADVLVSAAKVNKLYRLQNEGHGCNDSDFKHLSVRAAGNEPFWNLYLASDGLLLTQPGGAPIALPYLEEMQPDGGLYISAQQESEYIQVWLKPQICIDSMSGALHHMAAILDWNGHKFNGCAHFGGQRK